MSFRGYGLVSSDAGHGPADGVPTNAVLPRRQVFPVNRIRFFGEAHTRRPADRRDFPARLKTLLKQAPFTTPAALRALGLPEPQASATLARLGPGDS